MAGAAIGLPNILPVRAQQKYPDRPIKMIVPFPPGGPIDTMARMTGQELTSRVGQVVVENRRPSAPKTSPQQLPTATR
jgi:tripartite-type tricarboxylate transporter receptor subunit TctC